MTTCLTPTEARAVNRAITILERAFGRGDACFVNTPTIAHDLLRLRLGGLQREEFHAFWVDAHHRLIQAETLVVGTLAQTAVYPREVVKSALAHNAAGVVFAHNHPSGTATPSRSDWLLTDTLRDALQLVGVALLDHVVVTATDTVSMDALARAEREQRAYATLAEVTALQAKRALSRATRKTAKPRAAQSA